MSTESEYIEVRKKQANKLSRKFKLMQVFPIRKNKIVFSTFEGDGGFCCNPRYIAEELHRRGNRYEMVWLTHDMTHEFPDYIKVVRDTSWNVVYHLSTAKVWVDNYRKPFGTLKRKGQHYIQTWHASIGFKAVGLYRGKEFPEIARLVSEWDSNLADYFISNSDYCDKVYPKKLLYSGPTLRTGSPRVDCLINCREELYATIRKKYGIAEDTKLLMFAPTFRGGNQKGKKQVLVYVPNIDFNRLLSTLEEKFREKWKVLLRLHPQLSAKFKEMPLHEKDERFIDVSQASDMSEIMAACDMVITDYSSCAFDASFSGIPVMLYADDIQEYIENRGQFMWKKDELPFDIAENNDELMENIANFSYKRYTERVESFKSKHGVNEDGMASVRVADKIDEYLLG